MARDYYTQIAIETNYLEMLDGLSFRWFDSQTIAASASKYYLIYIPPEIDLLFYGRAFDSRTTNFSLELFAAPTFSSEGASMSDRMYNRNSDYSSATLASIWADPTITDEGTLVDIDSTYGSVSTGSGNKGSAGSGTTRDFPRIMPKDSYILAKVTNLSVSESGYYTYKLFWSEVLK